MAGVGGVSGMTSTLEGVSDLRGMGKVMKLTRGESDLLRPAVARRTEGGKDWVNQPGSE